MIKLVQELTEKVCFMRAASNLPHQLNNLNSIHTAQTLSNTTRSNLLTTLICLLFSTFNCLYYSYVCRFALFLLLLLLFVTLGPEGRQLCPQKLGNSILGWTGKHIGMGRLISVRIYPIHVKTGYSKHIVIRPITIVTYVYSLKCYYKPCVFHIIKRNTRLPINRFFHRFKSNNGIIQFPNSTSID